MFVYVRLWTCICVVVKTKICSLLFCILFPAIEVANRLGNKATPSRTTLVPLPLVLAMHSLAAFKSQDSKRKLLKMCGNCLSTAPDLLPTLLRQKHHGDNTMRSRKFDNSVNTERRLLLDPDRPSLHLGPVLLCV